MQTAFDQIKKNCVTITGNGQTHLFKISLIISLLLTITGTIASGIFYFCYYRKKRILKARKQTKDMIVDGGDFHKSETGIACLTDNENDNTFNPTEGTLAVLSTKA